MDSLSEAGAHRLAAQINAYWRSLGYEVSTWVEPFTAGNLKTMYAVRSDMVAGHPQRKMRAAA